MDYVRDESGKEILEFKEGRVYKTIILQDFMDQLNEYRKKND
jgi:hypothetical protein